MTISQISALTVHISFLLLRTPIWQTKCWQIYPPMAISKIPALTAHISFLLWELIFGRPGISDLPPSQTAIIDSYSESSYLADQVLVDHPPFKWQFYRFLLWQLTFHSYSESSYLADQEFQIYPPSQTAIIDSYSEISYLADQVLADQPPFKWQFHRFLLWQLIFHSYSWELIFGRPSVGRSSPLQMAISQILALTAHISFLLWELIFGRPNVGRSILPVKQQL